MLALAARAESTPATLTKAPEPKAILVTGATSGIGRNIAETLAREGYRVYAGARKQSDIDELSAIENIEGIRLDVTVQKDVDEAVALIRERGTGLHGLVNNAGVAIFAPLIEVDEIDMRFVMDVNLMGPWRVTRGFAPLLIESKGRITTIGSISGTVSGMMFGPYSMSKHAVEAYTDSLAREMEKFGVGVSVIEPGNFKSDIAVSVRNRMRQRGQSTEGSRYREELERIMAAPADRSNFDEPDAVSAAVKRALFDADPQRRYMVVPNQREAEITIRKAIEELVQLNQNQPFAYDREALIRMLDEALAPASE
jgi:NAD(P)-dependent dehydrogenase (short-subunit alcohol dehydrogenase family)